MRSEMRFGLSASEKRDVWSRWKAGQTLHEIGRAFDKPHSCIRAVLLPRGGIPLLARRRSRLAPRLAEREDISRGIAPGSSIREIASRLERAAHRKSGNHSPSWLSCLSAPSPGLDFGLAPEEMFARREPQVARHRCVNFDVNGSFVSTSYRFHSQEFAPNVQKHLTRRVSKRVGNPSASNTRNRAS